MSYQKKSSEFAEILIAEETLSFSFPKSWISSKGVREIQDAFFSLLLPHLPTSKLQTPHPISKKVFPRIAVFIESKRHYTGGRYSSVMYAVLLSQLCEVFIISDKPIFFKNDFKAYFNPRLFWVTNPQYLLTENKNIFDLIIGVPNISGVYAQKYAEKFNLPLGLVVFETPNYIRVTREGIDATEEYWQPFKTAMFKADFFITPSEISKTYLQSWYTDFKQKPATVVYPNINEQAVRSALSKMTTDRQQLKIRPRIVYSSRITDFKNPLIIAKELARYYDIDIIGNVPPHFATTITAADSNIHIHGTITDEEKYNLMMNADLLIHPSKFEGFGMSLMEAMFFGLPIVCYDLPIFHEVYGDYPCYVPLGQHKQFVERAIQVLKEKQGLTEVNPAPREINMRFHGLQGVSPHFSTREGIKYSTMVFPYTVKAATKQLLKAIPQIPKIAVGIIAYDCEDYLEYAVNSVYSIAHQIIIVLGAVKGYTQEIDYSKVMPVITKLMDKDIWGKIELVVGSNFFTDKIEMQNEIADRVSADYYVKVDPDEIWELQNLLDIIYTMEKDKTIQYANIPFLHFWTSFNYVAKDAGGKWSTLHSRVWRWKSGMRHQQSFNYFTMNGVPIKASSNLKSINGEKPIFHFGYVRTLEKIQRKLAYYSQRGIEPFVTDTYATWKILSDPTQPTQKTRSWAEVYDGKFPEILNNHPYRFIPDVRTVKE